MRNHRDRGRRHHRAELHDPLRGRHAAGPGDLHAAGRPGVPRWAARRRHAGGRHREPPRPEPRDYHREGLLSAVQVPASTVGRRRESPGKRRDRRRARLHLVLVLMLINLPCSVWAQEGSIEFFGGAGVGFPGDYKPRGLGESVTGGATQWWTNNWGTGVWFTAVAGRDGRNFEHMIRPSVRYSTLMYDGRATLYLGISPAMITDAFGNSSQGILLEPSVDLFVGVSLSSSINVRGGRLHLYLQRSLSPDSRGRVDPVIVLDDSDEFPRGAAATCPQPPGGSGGGRETRRPARRCGSRRPDRAEPATADLTWIIREEGDSGGDTGASVWYKRCVHKRLATMETPA